MRKFTYITVIASLSIVLGYIEQLIPLPLAIPGVKIGLSNIGVLVALYLIGNKSAFFVSLIKSLVCGILFWGIGGAIYGIVGALLSFVAMALSKKVNIFGIVGVSVIGALFHNIGQLLVITILSKEIKVLYYLVVLGVSAVVFGAITGAVSTVVINRLKKLKIFEKKC